MSQYGRLRHGGEVEKAAISRCFNLLPFFLRELERQHGLDEGSVPNPKSFSTASVFDRWPEDDLPTIVSRAGAPRPGHKAGSGYQSVIMPFDVGAVLKAQKQKDARLWAHLYGTAICACMMQRQGLGAGLQGVTLVGGDPVGDVTNAGSSAGRRTLAGVAFDFEVEIREFVSTAEGPTEFVDGPLEWPDVTQINVEVESQ